MWWRSPGDLGVAPSCPDHRATDWTQERRRGKYWWCPGFTSKRGGDRMVWQRGRGGLDSDVVIEDPFLFGTY